MGFQNTGIILFFLFGVCLIDSTQAANGPVFVPSSPLTITVNLETYEAGGLINSAESEIINFEIDVPDDGIDLATKYQIPNATKFLVLDKEGLVSFVVRARESPFVLQTTKSTFVRKIELELNETVKAGTYNLCLFVSNALAVDGSTRLLTVGVEGVRPSPGTSLLATSK